MKKLLLVFLPLLSPAPAGAVSESSLQADSPAILANYAKGDEGDVAASDGVKLHYHLNKVANEKGAVVLMQGRGENTAKYAELIFDLNQKGYSVYTYDDRGQGLSGGRLTADPQKSSIKNFDLYVSDMKTFVDQVVKPATHQNLHLLAHSMGGGIGSLYLENNPGIFQSAALVSPAFGLNTGHSDAVVKLATCPWTGSGEDFAKGKGPYNPSLAFSDPGNHYTNSPARYTFFRSQMGADPKATVGGPTDNWVCQSVKAGERAKAGAKDLGLPIFIAKADNDTADSRIEDEEEFCQSAKHCESQLFAGKHELLMEKDSTRDPLLGGILALFQANSGKDSKEAIERVVGAPKLGAGDTASENIGGAGSVKRAISQDNPPPPAAAPSSGSAQ